MLRLTLRWCLLLALAGAGHAWAQQPVAAPIGADALSGTWLVPAEDGDDVDAVIVVVRDGAQWRGHIQGIPVTRADQKWHDDSPCQGCPPPARGKPFKGLRILWDVQADGEGGWQGHILDPSDGRTYRCQIHLASDGRLKVLAYVGLPVLGHTMTWRRWP